MSEPRNPPPGDDDWGGPEETPWQQQPPPPPQQPPQQPPPQPQQQPQEPPRYGQQPPQFGGQQASSYGQQQPQYGAPPTHQSLNQIPNYLVHSILATLLCCPPTGIVGIVFATQVSGKVAAGDLAGAKKSSDQAKLWTIISVAAGFIGWVIYIGLYSSATGV